MSLLLGSSGGFQLELVEGRSARRGGGGLESSLEVWGWMEAQNHRSKDPFKESKLTLSSSFPPSLPSFDTPFRTFLPPSTLPLQPHLATMPFVKVRSQSFPSRSNERRKNETSKLIIVVFPSSLLPFPSSSLSRTERTSPDSRSSTEEDVRERPTVRINSPSSLLLRSARRARWSKLVWADLSPPSPLSPRRLR